MKILFVSMHSIHAIRWIENLQHTNHQLYWFDVTGQGEIKTFSRLNQMTAWKKRKLPYIKGEHWLKKQFPAAYNFIRPFLEVTESEAFERALKDIKPDLVQSFEMQTCSYAIYEAMINYPKVKWLYNCWGSDIFYYEKFSQHKKKINQVLERADFMIADNFRDRGLARKNGFNGKFLASLPGGGGYDLSFFESYKEMISDRKYIIVKGYHHLFGRGLNIIKALSKIAESHNFEVVVFGAHKIVEDYVKNNNLPFKVYDRHGLSQNEVLKIMGNSVLYIGNNISDGIPNTLLEAMLMGAFPIQSNPGGATAEIINNGENGFLIENPENIEEIKTLILKSIANLTMRENAFVKNQEIARNYLDYELNQQKIIAIYQQIEKD